MDTKKCLLLLDFDLSYEKAREVATEDAKYILATYPDFDEIIWDVNAQHRDEREESVCLCVSRIFRTASDEGIETIFCDVCQQSGFSPLYSLLRELLRECRINVVPMGLLKGETE